MIVNNLFARQFIEESLPCIEDFAIRITSKGNIRHPNPRAAVGLGVVMIVGALWELVINPPNAKLWKDLVPTGDQALKQELTRSFLSYLATERHGE